jgi:hypothetical protein
MNAVRSSVRPATRWMHVVSTASARRIAGRMVVSLRIRLDVPAARLRASSRWAQGRLGLPAEAVRAEIRLIVGHNSPPRRCDRIHPRPVFGRESDVYGA